MVVGFEMYPIVLVLLFSATFQVPDCAAWTAKVPVPTTVAFKLEAVACVAPKDVFAIVMLGRLVTWVAKVPVPTTVAFRFAAVACAAVTLTAD